MRKYNYLHDPAHGWFRVKTKELVELGITDKISSYSYVSPSKKSVYLEEDSDATIFFNALYASGVRKEDVTIVDKYSDKPSPIRNLASYQYDGTNLPVDVPVQTAEIGENTTKNVIDVEIPNLNTQVSEYDNIGVAVGIAVSLFFIVINIIT